MLSRRPPARAPRAVPPPELANLHARAAACLGTTGADILLRLALGGQPSPERAAARAALARAAAGARG